MTYEKYKEVRTEEEFWKDWNPDEVDSLTPSIMKQIYKRYLVKCIVYQRDRFKCKNDTCKTPHSKITFHHIKFQKNEGKDSPKNCITICNVCHQKYHKGKATLTFNGMTYRIHKEKSKFNWKAYKSKAKEIRKENKEFHGIIISWKLMLLLLKFLETDYTECLDD